MKKLFRTESPIVWGSLVLSVIAIFVASWQGCLIRDSNQITRESNENTREYYELSVTPHLGADVRTGTGFRGIRLVNDGLGPAIVTQITIKVDNNSILPANRQGWREAKKQLGLDYGWVEFCWLKENGYFVIPADEEIELFGVRKNEFTEDRIELIRKALFHIGFEIWYNSIYGKSDSLSIEPISDF